MKLLTASLFSAVLLAVAMPADAQTTKKAVKKENPAVESAKKRCQENRGTNCETKEGLAEWVRQERPLTAEQQRAAAGARRAREGQAR